MGRPRTIDYDAVYPHFLAGASLSALAEKFEVNLIALKRFAYDHKWETTRKELCLSSKLTKRDLDPIKQAEMIVEARNKFVSSVSKASVDVALSLDNKVSSVKTFEEKALAMSQFKPAFDIGKGVFGLGNEAPTNNFEVNFMSNLSWDDIPQVKSQVQAIEADAKDVTPKQIKRATKDKP